MTRAAAYLLLLLCLVAPAAAGQPAASQLKQAFVLHLEDDGAILLPKRQSLTLRELLLRVRKATAEYDTRNPVAAGATVCEMPVVLHIAPNVPWQNVQIVLGVVEQANCYRVWFARAGKQPGKSRYIDAILPRNRAATYQKTKTGLLRIRTTVVQLELVPVAGKLAQREWSLENTVFAMTQPTAVTYRIGADQEYADLSAAGSVVGNLAAMRRVANPADRVRVLISTTPRTPFHLVAGAIEMFDRSLFGYVELLAAPPLARQEWNSHYLPLPPTALKPGVRMRVLGGDAKETYLVAPWSAKAALDTAQAKLLTDASPLDPRLLLPLGPGAKLESGPFTGGRLVVNLAGDGALRVRGLQLSIEAFTTFFRAYVATRTMGAQPKGMSRILLRVDGAAPWAHVLALLSVLRAHGVGEVEFGVRLYSDENDDARDAREFAAPRIGATVAEDARVVGYVTVKLQGPPAMLNHAETLAQLRTLDRTALDMHAERMVETHWGPKGSEQRVSMPLNVRFDWRGKRSYSMRRVMRWVMEERASKLARGGFFGGRKTRCLVSATEKVPARYVIAALARLQSLAWNEIWVYAHYRPAEVVRIAPTMLYPESNRLVRVEDGLGVFSAAGR